MYYVIDLKGNVALLPDQICKYEKLNTQITKIFHKIKTANSV